MNYQRIRGPAHAVKAGQACRHQGRNRLPRGGADGRRWNRPPLWRRRGSPPV